MARLQGHDAVYASVGRIHFVEKLIEVPDRAAGENRTQQVSHISRSLKNLARELGTPVIALSQLSRSTEQRTPPIPILSDLRDSGGIEQDSDIVLMLYREDMYNEDCDTAEARHKQTDSPGS